MTVIANEFIEASIRQMGAELTSIYHKKVEQEYMWNANPDFWDKSSPVLFPIVGALKNDTYFFENTSYQLSRHGFARNLNFTLSAHTPTSATFTLLDDEYTFKRYPFRFRFNIIYTLSDNVLSVTYTVVNTDNKEIFFSIGGHPAFKVPLTEGTTYSDYYLEFENDEKADRWLISEEGLIEEASHTVLDNTNHLPLTKELFYNDALVFKNLKSSKVSLKSSISKRGFLFDYSGFPYLGIWAAKDANFVCIEPWCGIADGVSSNQQLIKKQGLNRLAPLDTFKRSWTVTLF